ncbi:MAG: acylphosphatase [Eubacterium sp.]|nr:acylphosphatase [Eubacterium sp.]
MKKRKHFIFTGRVQGVGFRYKAYYIANNRGLTGYVRNLYDGSVEMEVQGKDGDIDIMIKMLKEDRYILIEGMETRTMEIDEEERYFVKK